MEPEVKYVIQEGYAGLWHDWIYGYFYTEQLAKTTFKNVKAAYPKSYFRLVKRTTVVTEEVID